MSEYSIQDIEDFVEANKRHRGQMSAFGKSLRMLTGLLNERDEIKRNAGRLFAFLLESEDRT
jgi:hypothetical protein